MEARENRFKKLRKLARTEDEDDLEEKFETEKRLTRRISREPESQNENQDRKMMEGNILTQLSLEGKNTTDSDETHSLEESGDSDHGTGRSRLKRLKKILDPSETKEPFEEEIRDDPECPICLSKIEKESARINCCNHIFCFDCIKDWTDVANQCPLCKKRISRIQKFSVDGVKINEVRIKFKDQDFQEPEFEVVENTDEACYECGSASDMQRLLVCDECHFYCCHTYCCTPPLRRVPIDPWFCNFCRSDVVEARPVNRNREAQRNRNNRNQRILPENPPPRRNNLSRTNKVRSNESAVTQSIRNSLAENSLLKKLFDAADKEQERKRPSNKSSIFQELSEKETKTRRRPSKSTKRTVGTTKKRNSRKSKDTSRERSRSKSAKSKVTRRKPKESSRSVKRTGDKKKKVTKKRAVSAKKKN